MSWWGADRYDLTRGHARARELLVRQMDLGYRRTDHLFAVLLAVEWLAAMLIAALVSPGAWTDETVLIDTHVWMAVLLGGAIVSLPLWLAWRRPGEAVTRHVIAMGQMLVGALLIHLTSGRIETHFHVFGSLAFLALYRDWRVLVTASAVVVADHWLRGVFWPRSVFGVVAASPWRWVEHAAWVVFEAAVLIQACRVSVRELAELAVRQADAEEARARIEHLVQERERDHQRAEAILRRSHDELEDRVRERTTELQEANASLVEEITERRRTEELLCDSEARFRGAFEAAAIGMAIKDPQGRFLRVNPAYVAMLGYTEDELLGTDANALTHPDDRGADAAEAARVLSGEADSYHIEKRYVHRLGHVVWVQLTASLVRDQEGRPSQFVTQVEDITRRRQAEDALRRSMFETRRLAMVAARTDNAVVITDERGRIEWVNQGFTRLSGYELDEVVGRTPGSVLHGPETDLAAVAQMRERVRRGEGFKSEVLNYNKQGAAYWVALDIEPVHDESGTLTHFIAIERDMTSRRESERILLQAKEAAESATRAKGEFLANMSHEIRTPMNGILGMTELALDTDLTPRQREYLEMVRTSAESLLTVINDILDFSKIEAGKLEIDLAPFALRDALEGTVRTLALRAHAKGLELACRIAPEVPEAVVGDSGRLRQVLVNLIGNAIKFTERGEVVVGVDTMPGESEGPLLHVTVTDTGIGIAPETLRRIFEPFEQADGSTTRRFGGTGLGLSISSKLVALMGGTIWVESVPGRGSTFHFTIRLEEAPADSGVHVVWPARLNGTPVLVVDDNTTNRRILLELLSSWGLRPTMAADGYEALAALRAATVRGEPFTAVLVDAMMPGMDGWALIRRIRSEPSLSGVRLLLLSSAGAPDDPGEARELAVSACLTKPVRQSELYETLARVLVPGEESETAAPAECATAAAPDHRRLRILLAEDQPVNQKVAARMLEGLGHAVTVAADGREALELLDKTEGNYDLVLMDVQMPRMDGFEALEAIRHREAHRGGHLPIVALTAHAMKGDRERCLAAGFDAYLAKPIRRPDLMDVIDGLARQSNAAPEPNLSLPAGLLEVSDGDEAFARELIGSFLETAPVCLGQIEQALAEGEASALAAAAHGLKGISQAVGLTRLAELCRELEKTAKVEEFPAAASAAEAVAEAWSDARATFERYVAAPA